MFQHRRVAQQAWNPPEELIALDEVGNTRGADVTWRRVTKPAGLGFFIAGDAAFVVDPASSDGVIRAIMSGILSGYHIAEIIRRPKMESAAIAEYTHWIGQRFDSEVINLARIYDPSFPGWRDRF